MTELFFVYDMRISSAIFVISQGSLCLLLLAGLAIPASISRLVIIAPVGNAPVAPGEL